ncbi:unnamed protein product [Parnassius apollo]|uniref:(apollo) hypothetical protein n=1 Tax=Parnassius apollo TaxID=110799 RepID=A0A8S3XUQ0_PARAO|nr:unnamed protein product [Parnassius apollo]
MVSKNCKNSEIEEPLRQLETDEISDDRWESEGDDLDYFSTREDVHVRVQALEDDFETCDGNLYYLVMITSTSQTLLLYMTIITI